jgi:hypothetical protein
MRYVLRKGSSAAGNRLSLVRQAGHGGKNFPGTGSLMPSWGHLATLKMDMCFFSSLPESPEKGAAVERDTLD